MAPVRATYRLQLGPGLGFDEAAALVPYLRDLGVSHLYLSPVLQAAPGSTHGYDVVDHARLSEDLGGEAAFDRLARAARDEDMGIVLDVVPNHVAVTVPEWHNPRLWSVLRDGPTSPSAGWFDVDWSIQHGAMLMPVLGRRIGQCLEDGEITLDRAGPEPVVRYHDHAFPVRPGTEDLPLPELLSRQWYRLAHWRVADEELNYRRFFDVDTLAAIRVEHPEVFDETHALLVRLCAGGAVDGLRIDHPDGLADPRGYLRRLRARAPGTWLVVEKILEGDEQLPADWPCDGTTGYEALARVLQLLLDPGGAEPLTGRWVEATGEPRDYGVVAEHARRDVLAGPLRAEVNRLAELAWGICQGDVMLRDFTRRGIEDALVEILVAMPVYRAYVVPGEPAPDAARRQVGAAAALAGERAPGRAEEVGLVAGLALGDRGRGRRRDEFLVRFQQTSGPVMAKGVEDTALYRWLRLVAANEVGADPSEMGEPPDRLHAWAAAQQDRHPHGMTTLSTHDTKRSEDVRARLAVLSELGREWADRQAALSAAGARHRDAEGRPDPVMEHLMWQTVVGAWPIDAGRLAAYMEKASREAKVHTSWTSPDEAYDAALRGFAEGALGDPEVVALVEAASALIAPHARANVLAQKLVQLTIPGIPDTYQGCEVVRLSLVDPDNRRPVDWDGLREALTRLDAGAEPRGLDDEKLLVTSRALRLRRERPGWFAGEAATYEPLPTGSAHAVGFVRGGGAVTLVTRLPAGLARAGGFGAATAALPRGEWIDVLTGAAVGGGAVPLGDLLGRLPVALLAREA